MRTRSHSLCSHANIPTRSATTPSFDFLTRHLTISPVSSSPITLSLPSVSSTSPYLVPSFRTLLFASLFYLPGFLRSTFRPTVYFIYHTPPALRLPRPQRLSSRWMWTKVRKRPTASKRSSSYGPRTRQRNASSITMRTRIRPRRTALLRAPNGKSPRIENARKVFRGATSTDVYIYTIKNKKRCRTDKSWSGSVSKNDAACLLSCGINM